MKIFDRTLNYCAFAAGVIIVLLMFIITLDISLRYFANSPFIWTTEVTEICLLFITFLGTAWVLRRGGHVGVDILLVRLSSKNRLLLGMISSIIGVLISLVLVWAGTRVTWQHLHEGIRNATILEIPKGPLLTIIPVGFLLLLVQFLRSAYIDWRKWRTA